MVVKLDPSNKLGRAQLEATQKLIKRMQFEAVSVFAVVLELPRTFA